MRHSPMPMHASAPLPLFMQEERRVLSQYTGDMAELVDCEQYMLLVGWAV